MRRSISILLKIISVALISLLVALLVYANQIGGVYLNINEEISYWRYRHAIDYSFVLCLGAIPLGMLFAIIQIFIWRLSWMTIVLVLASLTLGCSILPNLLSNIFFTMLGEYRHHDTIVTNTHIYHLSSEWKIGVGGASRAVYLLWECNRQGEACHIIMEERKLPIYSQTTYENTEALIEFDAQTGITILLIEE
ncbi:MAG: hypothetical protein AAFV93_12345 [Chloroflexota bacterium]